MKLLPLILILAVPATVEAQAYPWLGANRARVAHQRCFGGGGYAAALSSYWAARNAYTNGLLAGRPVNNTAQLQSRLDDIYREVRLNSALLQQLQAGTAVQPTQPGVVVVPNPPTTQPGVIVVPNPGQPTGAVGNPGQPTGAVGNPGQPTGAVGNPGKATGAVPNPNGNGGAVGNPGAVRSGIPNPKRYRRLLPARPIRWRSEVTRTILLN